MALGWGLVPTLLLPRLWPLAAPDGCPRPFPHGCQIEGDASGPQSPTPGAAGAALRHRLLAATRGRALVSSHLASAAHKPH
jgi:hypothetical protein